MTVVMLRHSGYWGRELIDGDADIVVVDLAGAVISEAAAARYRRIYRLDSWGDLTNLARVAGDLLAENVAVEMVYSPIEFTQAAAGYLREALGRAPNAVSVVLATRDKRVMKQIAHRAGLHATPWRTVHGDARDADLAAVAADLGFPVVAKPVDGFGTTDTEVLTSAEELSTHTDKILGDSSSATRMFVCEAFVPGVEFHADALLDAGEIVSILVSRYLHPPRELRQGATPDLSIGLAEQSAPELYRVVREGLTAFAREAGLTAGPVHFEFFAGEDWTRWGPGGLVFSEIASRIGGGNIADLVGTYTGVSMRAQTLAQGRGGDLSALPWTPPPAPFVGLLNLVPTASGTIASMPDSATLSAEPGVLFVSVRAQVGDTFEVGVSTATWTAVVVLGADTEDDLVRRAGELVDRYPITVR